MSGALFKSGSDAANIAAPPRFESNARASEPAAGRPDPRDIENAALREENRKLGNRLAVLQADWDSKLASARAAAKEEAVREHVRADERIAETIERALSGAASEFKTVLAGQVEPLAASLAANAVGLLVSLTGDETEWLTRVISRRLEGIACSSVTAIHIAPGIGGAAIEALDAAPVPQGIALVSDPALPAGTAKIVLRLGEIEIIPDVAARTLTGILEQAGERHD